jgi:hypothetical protein
MFRQWQSSAPKLSRKNWSWTPKIKEFLVTATTVQDLKKPKSARSLYTTIQLSSTLDWNTTSSQRRPLDGSSSGSYGDRAIPVVPPTMIRRKKKKELKTRGTTASVPEIDWEESRKQKENMDVWVVKQAHVKRVVHGSSRHAKWKRHRFSQKDVSVFDTCNTFWPAFTFCLLKLHS